MPAPYDILHYFDADEDDLELVQIGADDDWIDVPEDHRLLNATLLVVWYRKGVTKIAVKCEERTVEFDLRGVILRDGSDNPTERVQ